MKSLHLFTVPACLALLIVGLAPSLAAQGRPNRATSFRSLQQPPPDTAEARRSRIWLGIERTSNCRVTVTIADSSGAVVRHLLSKLLQYGFYNIYWDKRDDSGHYVAPGEYVVHINDCGKASVAEVQAAYRPFENLTELTVVESETGQQISLSLAADSARVSLFVLTMARDQVATVVADTLVAAGNHVIPLNVDNSLSPGRNLVCLYINEGFVRETEFTCTP